MSSILYRMREHCAEAQACMVHGIANWGCDKRADSLSRRGEALVTVRASQPDQERVRVVI
jgi:hypothetical protein